MEKEGDDAGEIFREQNHQDFGICRVREKRGIQDNF